MLPVRKQNPQTRICPYSGLEFVPKRSNQVFIDSESRIAFNNEKNNSKRKKLAYINRPLQKNYDILKGLLGNQNEMYVHSEHLRGAGFSFKVFTHLNEIRENDDYVYGIYHFQIERLKNNIYKISKQ